MRARCSRYQSLLELQCLLQAGNIDQSVTVQSYGYCNQNVPGNKYLLLDRAHFSAGLMQLQLLYTLTLQEFFQGMRDVDRENEVHRILGAFKLNPFEQLGLRFDATVDDVKKAYRKSSLMVHPDKCKHPKAQDAFEILGQAQQQLNNEEKMKELIYVLTLARGVFLSCPMSASSFGIMS